MAGLGGIATVHLHTELNRQAQSLLWLELAAWERGGEWGGGYR